MTIRIVAVFGATDTQGSSVIKALLTDGTFTPRAVTRDATSEKALKLKQLGVEVVEGDQWNVASLKNAMDGAEAVFGVTAFWDPKNLAHGPTGELTLGKNLVDAAIQAKVNFFIWSSLPHTAKASQGKYRNVQHFDNKANIEDYLRDSQLPHANLRTGWFCENTWNLHHLNQTPDSSSYELTIPLYDPNSAQYFFWVECDLGQCVLALLRHYKDNSANILGETFYGVGDKMSYTEYAKKIEKGSPVRFMTCAATGKKDRDEMYAFKSELGMYPGVTIPDPRLDRLGVKFHSNEMFAEEEIKKRYA